MRFFGVKVGLVASRVMSRLFQAEGAAALERWLKVLKAGVTLKPLELMKLADADMSSPASIHNAVAYLGSSEVTYKVGNVVQTIGATLHA